MKKVVNGNELKNKMLDAINMLCDTVKVTLGPKGHNIIIDHSNFSPFITNDGVTIAQNIESKDEVINTILELAKEASIKTNEVVGDGTTTTLVLLQSIFINGLELINKGVNPIILKEELNEALDEVIKTVKNKARKPTDKDLLNIATISSNDEEIGKLISQAYINTRSKNAITINEADDENTTLEFIKGYSFDTELASPYFLKDKNEINLNNAKILIIDYINSLEDIGLILNEIKNKNLSLVILSNGYSDDFVNDSISLKLDGIIDIYLLKTPEYGLRQESILKDISVITNARIINNDIVLLHHLGDGNIIINENNTTLSFDINEHIEARIKELEYLLSISVNDINKEFYSKTLSMFKTCLANINVGAVTKTERREKKMRFDDALCAIESSISGILPGGGLVLLEISDAIESKTNGYKILKDALNVPIKQILINSGLNYENVINEIKHSNYEVLYNVKSDKYEKISDTKVIDPLHVIITSLKNACSIASMLLTTSNLIINEYKNNYNKINDFNEL